MTTALNHVNHSTVSSPANRKYQLTGRPTISYSEIRTYQTCPLKWQFQYVDNAEKESLSSAMLLGTCVHAAIQRLLETRLSNDPTPTIDQLIDIYRKTWNKEAQDIPIQFPKDQDASATETLAKRMIEKFLLSEFSAPAGDIIGIEESFQAKLGNDLPDLAGRIDLLTQENGKIVVSDFKTVRCMPSEESADEMADQLALYSVGCKPIADSFGLPLNLRYIYLTKTKEPKVQSISVTVDPAKVSRTLAIVRAVFKNMQSCVPYPNPSPINCPGCPFREKCGKWHEDT